MGPASKIGAVDALFFLVILFFLANREIRDTYAGTTFRIQSMVAKRGLTNQANVHTPFVKKSFKTQHDRIPIDQTEFQSIKQNSNRSDRIPIDPAILAANGQIQRKFKLMMRRFEGDVCGNQKPETLLLALTSRTTSLPND